MAAEQCPLMRGPCIKHDCKWYIQIQGMNPQTSAMISEHDCAVAWLPMLLIENTQQARQAGAAVESFRNEVVKRHDDTIRATTELLTHSMTMPVLPHAPRFDALPLIDAG